MNSNQNPSKIGNASRKKQANKSRPNSSQGSQKVRQMSSQSRPRAANVGKSVQTENRKPVQKMLKNGNILVSHREFIGKVPGSVNFSISSNPINPGLPAQFNWLWAIAGQYESYIFKKLKYIFINSKTGTFSGEVIMGIDYDASDPTPFNELELQNYWGCKTGVLTEPLEIIANLPALHKVPQKFCRLGNLSANQDIKLYDCGNFFLATSDCADTSNIGRLFVEYEVELITPQVNASNVLSGNSVFATGVTQAAPLGTAQPTVLGALGVVWLSGTTFSVPIPGQYMFVLTQTGTTITVAPTLTAASPSLRTLVSAGISGAIADQIIYLIRVNSASDIFTLGLTTAATITGSTIYLSPYAFSQ